MREARFADVHAAGDFLVIVATDRLSAFDYILPTAIPDKSRVLTALTILAARYTDRFSSIRPEPLKVSDIGFQSA